MVLWYVLPGLTYNLKNSGHSRCITVALNHMQRPLKEQLARRASDSEGVREVRVPVKWFWVTIIPTPLLGKKPIGLEIVMKGSIIQSKCKVSAMLHSSDTLWLR